MHVRLNPSSLLGVVQRALPRVIGVVFGVLIMSRWGGGFLFWFGFLMVLFSVLTNPVNWLQYVVTGHRPVPTTDPRYTETGNCRVDLSSSGNRPIEVVKAVREVTNLGLVEAKGKVDKTPSTIVSGLSERSAVEVRTRLERAGGAAIVGAADCA